MNADSSFDASGPLPSLPPAVVAFGAARRRAIDTFAAALQRGERPDLDAVLAGLSSEDRATVLPELARLDLANRIAADEVVRAEDYFARYPDLRDDRQAALALISAEFAARRHRDPSVSSAEFLDRFPEFSDDLSTCLRDDGDPFCDGRTRQATPGPGSNSDPERTRTFDSESIRQAQARREGWPEVPGYQILSVLGRGGMGVVYQARDEGLGRLVALKMILSGTQARPEEIERFRSEMQALARLQHPHVVQIYDHGEHDGRPFCALEFVSGGSLSGKLRGEPQPGPDAARIMATLARAIHACHQVGVVHRDLKPANVLMTTDGTPKVTDFGLAKKLDDDIGLTRSGAVMGTPSYMAPEQAFGDLANIGPCTDVWALGAMLYEMLTGRVPFKGPSLVETIDLVRHADPVLPRTLVPQVPRDLETIALKCLQKDAARRYPSAAALADDLERFLDGRPITARPVGVAEKAWKLAQRRPLATGLTATTTVLLIVATVGGFALLAERAVSADARAEAADARAEAAEADARQLRVEDETRQAIQRQAQLASDNFRSGKLNEAEAASQQAVELLAASETLRDKEPLLVQQVDEMREKVRVALADTNRHAGGFVPQRDRARFYGQSFTDLEIATNRVAIIDACRTGLGLYGLGDPSRPVGREALDRIARVPIQPRDHAVDCYELLLTWADALDPKKDAETALQLLQRAEELGREFQIESRTLHRRRAAYLTRSGDQTAADAELAKVDDLPEALDIDRYQEALERFQASDFAAARTRFEQLASRRPGDFWTRYLQGVCSVRLGRYEEAKVALDASIDASNGKHIWPLLILGIARRQLGEFAEADEAYSDALKLADDDLTRFVALVNRGVSRLGQRRWDEAIADGEAALALPVGSKHIVHNNLAQAHAGKGDLPAAIASVSAAMTQQPTLAALDAQRATYHLAAADQARRQILTLTGGPEEPGVPRPELDAAGRAEVAALRETAEREDEAAAADYASAARKAKGDDKLLAGVQFQLGRLLDRQGDASGALAAFDAALDAQKRAGIDNPLVHRFRAEPLLRLRRLTDAHAALNTYLSQAKQPTADVFLARGLLAFDLGRLHDAVHDYTLALQASAEGRGGQLRGRGTTDATARQRSAEAFVRVQRGWSYLLLNAAQVAETDFRSAIDPSDPLGSAAGWCGLANAQAKLGKLREALASVEKALQAGRSDSLHLYRAARAYAIVIGTLETSRSAADRPLREAFFEDQARCGELLRQAIESLPAEKRPAFWQGTVLADPEFAPVRRSTAFQKLAASMGRGAS